MAIVDEEWLNFQENGVYTDCSKSGDCDEGKYPKCSDIYISTQTKIAFLNQQVDLQKIFWELIITPYHIPKDCIIKKSMKINCINKKEVVELELLIKENNVEFDIIQQVDNPLARKIKFKDIRKISGGCCKKDLTSYRKKKKGAFYNCFALILRILYEGQYKEVHIKVFNTGKLEIPGIQKDELLKPTFEYLINILQPYFDTPLSINEAKIDTVLINSNFACNFFIDRNILYNKLKYKYNLHLLYDPCSYPGIQCKFYYNKHKKCQNGVCECEIRCDKDTKKIIKKNKCKEISFMIFRTGSVLIVGHCDMSELKIIYEFVKTILIAEYPDIHINGTPLTKKSKKKRLKTLNIRFTQ
jgi:TATA-box binding protein (TBP) (component of TFIID and TFIIIB)